MTEKEIKKRIKKIEKISSDCGDEVAHGLEDELREEFIKYIADYGDMHLVEKAKLVLSTNDIEFARWCG